MASLGGGLNPLWADSARVGDRNMWSAKMAFRHHNPQQAGLSIGEISEMVVYFFFFFFGHTTELLSSEH